ncbi:MAG: hypothetical protein M0R06_27030, partial [Sphaerochaeta sp.]|nr:hypothetical protein [Sphaerochaeta sp.]
AITGDTVNTLYYVTGDAGDAVIAAVGGVPLPTGKVVATAAQYNGIGLILSAGNIQVTMTAAAGTGSTRYVLSYIPLDPASAVVAA